MAQSETKPVAVIVVTYNRLRLLEECLEALRGQTYRGFDILVVDNASTDGTGDRLRPMAERGELLYYNTGANLGGAGGFNYGLRRGYELGYQYFWLMDDDTVPTPTALEAIVRAGEALGGDYGYLCSRAVWTDGTLCKMNLPDAPGGGPLSEPDENGLVPIERATFVGFFVARGIVERVGLPIREFFIWSDDTNYCLRINRIAKGYWAADSVVTHKMGSNTNANIVTDDSGRLERYVYAFRNRCYNYRMEGRMGAYWIYILKRLVRIITRAPDCRLRRIRYMLRGVLRGITFRPGIETVTGPEERTP